MSYTDSLLDHWAAYCRHVPLPDDRGIQIAMKLSFYCGFAMGMDFADESQKKLKDSAYLAHLQAIVKEAQAFMESEKAQPPATADEE